MKELKDQVIGYLNLGLHPTVISFPDDGLYYLFDKLLQGKTVSNSYDPTFTFVHVTLTHLSPDITPEKLEKEIFGGLEIDNYDGDTIIETYKNEVETVCVLDDIAFLDDVPKALEAAEVLIKKYRGILHFVYVVEDPMLIHKLKGCIPASSSFLDAIMYKEIGAYWGKSELAKMFEEQFRTKLSKEEINEISELSNNHLGTFKRLYKDKALHLNTTDRYIQLMIENLDNSLINTFRKVIKGVELTKEEDEVFHFYSKVGFLDSSVLKIPLILKVITKIIVPRKFEYNSKSNQLEGYDLHLFTKAEREIIQTLFMSKEIVTKEQLGDVIWGEDALEKYSEWAIDQRIARLRRKIIDLGMNIDIQTIYGKGYTLVFIEK